jgi:hypothetical protein
MSVSAAVSTSVPPEMFEKDFSAAADALLKHRTKYPGDIKAPAPPLVDDADLLNWVIEGQELAVRPFYTLPLQD